MGEARFPDGHEEEMIGSIKEAFDFASNAMERGALEVKIKRLMDDDSDVDPVAECEDD